MTTDQVVFDQQVKKHYKRNFIVNLMDGANFWFGYSFLSTSVILPLYVSHFSNNKVLIGLIAMIGTSGYFLPQLFTANWVQMLPVKKILPVNLGFFLERLPLLLLPLLAWATFRSPFWALLAFFIVFSWHSFGAGTIAVAWNDMIAKIIPLERRGFFFGLTNAIGSGTGVLGAGVASWLLTRYAFPYGFVFSFALAGLFVFISWVFLAQTVEPPLVTRTEKLSTADYWRSLPEILKTDTNFSYFLIAQIVTNMGGMSWGFLAVYAQQTWSLTDGRVGQFALALLLGQALANVVLGSLADRQGYKLVLQISILLAAGSLVCALLAPSPLLFFVVFALRGFNLGGAFLSTLMVYEFTTPDHRPTYIGLSNTLTGTVSALSPLVGGLIASVAAYKGLFAIALGLTLAGLALLTWNVRDPRKNKMMPLPQEGTQA